MPRYRFHRVQPHAKCPDLTGWYLELRPDDHDTIMAVHKGVCGVYFFKFGMDPHVQENETYRSHYNPIKLAAQWLVGIERGLMNGETVLVNCNGGIMPMNGVKILATVETDDITWDERLDREEITISRWPSAKHWYLSSSQGRIFIPAKYNTYAEAEQVARRFVPAHRIRTKENSGALPPE
jgi:hypothetical protein